MAKRLNILLVPMGGGERCSFVVNVLLLRFLLVIAVGAVIFVIVMAFTWGDMVKRAADYGRLQAEKTRLESENRRVIQLARDVEQNRRILVRIVRSLGGRVELGGNSAYDTTLVEDQFTEDVYEPPHEPTAAAPVMTAFASLESTTGYAIPRQMPVDGFVSRNFYEDYIFPSRSHRGIDIAGKTGTPILAAADGQIVFSGWTPHYGNCIYIYHLGGYITFYAHCLYNLKSARTEVKRGEPVALLGSSGISSAPHLHFEIWKDGVPIDPLEFIALPDSELTDG